VEERFLKFAVAIPASQPVWTVQPTVILSSIGKHAGEHHHERGEET
jgi:hypothetical protein